MHGPWIATIVLENIISIQLPDFSEHDGIILDVNSTHQREQYGFY